jgi:hypothetical protein
MYQPDYNTLRKQGKFLWGVSASYLALLEQLAAAGGLITMEEK